MQRSDDPRHGADHKLTREQPPVSEPSPGNTGDSGSVTLAPSSES